MFFANRLIAHLISFNSKFNAYGLPAVIIYSGLLLKLRSACTLSASFFINTDLTHSITTNLLLILVIINSKSIVWHSYRLHTNTDTTKNSKQLPNIFFWIDIRKSNKASEHIPIVKARTTTGSYFKRISLCLDYASMILQPNEEQISNSLGGSRDVLSII